MKIHTKDGLMFLVQVDHLTGELLGDIIDKFYKAGAKNVQVVSSITKKNRPSYMIFIDGRPETAAAIEYVIVKDCGSSGWHRIGTEHCYTNVSMISRNITVQIGSGSYEYEIQGKVIDDDINTVRPEHDSCAALQKFLTDKTGISIPQYQLSAYMSQAFRCNEDRITI